MEQVLVGSTCSPASTLTRRFSRLKRRKKRGREDRGVPEQWFRSAGIAVLGRPYIFSFSNYYAGFRRAHLRFVAKAEETCARRIRFDKIVSVFTSLPPSLVVSLVTSVTIIASLCNLVELIAGFFSFSSRDKREKEKLVEESLRLRSYICLLFLLVKFEILIGLEFSVLPKNFYTVPESITRKEC